MSKTKKCTACDGTGQQCTTKGDQLKQERIKARIRQGVVAKAMGFKQGYICQLEKGLRPLRAELVKAYRKALNQKQTKKKK